MKWSLFLKELEKVCTWILNRLDEIIYFRDLGKDEILKIVDLELVKTLSRAEKLAIKHNYWNTKQHLVEVGYDPKFGARPLKAIQKWVDDYVTEFVWNNPKLGTVLNLDYDKENNVTTVTVAKKLKRKRLN
jgi:ATP-dependent Clp protease ATP-binding subunit ClpE